MIFANTKNKTRLASNPCPFPPSTAKEIFFKKKFFTFSLPFIFFSFSNQSLPFHSCISSFFYICIYIISRKESRLNWSFLFFSQNQDSENGGKHRNWCRVLEGNREGSSRPSQSHLQQKLRSYHASLGVRNILAFFLSGTSFGWLESHINVQVS